MQIKLREEVSIPLRACMFVFLMCVQLTSSPCNNSNQEHITQSEKEGKCMHFKHYKAYEIDFG